jgi:hypothetical protein
MTNFNGQLPPEINFEDMFPQTTTESSKKTEKSAFDKRNYLDFSIPDGKTSKEVTIRLLPISPNEKEYFKIVHVHNISVNKDLSPNKSGKKAYMCLDGKNVNIDHTIHGSKCPVCEAQQELWNQYHNEVDATKKKEIHKEICSLNIREYAIARCIERGKEEDGVKFWRIPLRQDKTDPYHTIHALAKKRQAEGLESGVNINILSCKDGKDLIITFTEGNGAPTVVDKGISTPLTKDAELFNKWYYDEKKWTDVFSVKPYDYLKLVYEGEVPWYNKEKGCWVSKTEFEKNKNSEESVIEEQIKKVENQFVENKIETQQIITQREINQQQNTQVHSFNKPNFDDELPF